MIHLVTEIFVHFVSKWTYGFLSTQSAITLVVLITGAIVGWIWLVRASDSRFGFTHDKLPSDWIPLKSTSRITANVNGWQFEKKIRVIQCNRGIAVALARGWRHRFLVIPDESLEVIQENFSYRIGDKLSQIILVSRSDVACLDLGARRS